jgi:DNA-directed RNA polymerase specialized sigma24 family protein
MDPASSLARNEEQRALLRKQPWGKLSAQLTAIALKRIRGRSVDDAHDLAQAAIASAYDAIESGGWDPEKGPLVAFLVARVISSASNERRRKRNVCEVWLDEELDEEEGLLKHEKYLADGKPGADEALDRLRFAKTFHDRLLARLVGDEAALAAVPHMKEDLSTPRELAKATGRSFEDMNAALRRIRYHAAQITKELSASTAPRAAKAGSNEVM